MLGNILLSPYVGTAWSGRVQASAALASWGGLTLSPLMALQAVTMRSPTFSERTGFGANAAALFVARNNATTSRSEFGAQLDAEAPVGGVPLTPSCGPPGHAISSGMPRSPRASWPDVNAALLAAGLDAALSERVTLGVRLESELSANTRRLGGVAQMKISF